MSFVAKFEGGGPKDGQFMTLEADRLTENVKERGNPPMAVQVAEVKDGMLRMVTYLRYREPLPNGHWRYGFVPPKDN